MAIEVQVVAPITPDVKAAADLRTHQYKAVRFDAGGVRLATSDANSGPAYILWNKPNSGSACTLVGPPNIVKAIAAAAVVRGNWIQVSAVTSGFLAVGSDQSATRMGVAVSACASGSIFSLHIR